MTNRTTTRKQACGPFRSRGETQIARFLECHRIPYLYEHPLALLDDGKTKIWYPDFQLPSCGMLIEFYGMRNDAGYDEVRQHKESVYHANGLAALALTPSFFHGNWPRVLLDRIETTLAERLEMFRQVRYHDGARAEK